MRAVIYNSYGREEVLEMVEKPIPKSDEVLINVIAIILNAKDISARRGDYKIFMSRKVLKPTGSDFAGIVTSIGSDIKNFNVGDEVFDYEPGLSKGTAAATAIMDKNEISGSRPRHQNLPLVKHHLYRV